MRLIERRAMIGAVACLLLLSGCVVKDSPAPGCIETIGPPMLGGCFGKTAIVDLEVLSAPECMVVEANNCNGGVLEIRNSCSETIQLDGIEILPSRSVDLDIEESDGSLQLVETSTNFSQYTPEVDQRIELTGVVGNQAIELTFTKTGPLCE